MQSLKAQPRSAQLKDKPKPSKGKLRDKTLNIKQERMKYNKS